MPIPPLTFRRDLARKLTVEEGDGNLDNFDMRIAEMEDNPPTAVGISNITETATTFTVWLSNGTSYGPFVKPVATIKFRGEWAAATGYFANDLVFVTTTSTLYFITQNHISDATFDDTLENSGENIYVTLIGPLGFSTLAGLEDVTFTDRDPKHGDVIRYEFQLLKWHAEAEEGVVHYTPNTMTLDTGDLGKYFICIHVDGCVITIPTVAAGFGDNILFSGSGRTLKFCQRGGPITFDADTDVTLLRPDGLAAATDRVGAVVELRNVGDGSSNGNYWHLYGLLAEEDSDET